MSIFAAILGANSFQIDAQEAEKKLRSKYPLLLHHDERLELAFKGLGGMGRDKDFLTSHRILIQDVKGIGSKRKNFKSIPYKSIQAFSVQTAGKLDGDIELKVYYGGIEYARIEFAAGQVDIFSIKQFLNAKVVRQVKEGSQDAVLSEPIRTQQASSLGSFLGWIEDDAKAIDIATVEHRLKKETPVLVADEKVELAFKCGRDYTVFTTHRFLMVDVQGVLGKKVEFKSYLWSCISGFAVETAGTFLDRDTEMTIYTSIQLVDKIIQDFRKGKADVYAIQKCLCNKILGKDKAPLPDIDNRQGHVDPTTSWFGRDNSRPLDALEMNRILHSSPAILQGSEQVEIAFKGRRDIVLFTPKRILMIDRKGLNGVKVEYTSVPWKSVLGFGVETAGKHLDNDSEAKIWTDMNFIPGNGEDDPPQPGMSFLELDFNKNLIDIITIKKYLSIRCLEGAPDVAIPVNTLASCQQQTGFEKWLSKIGDDQRAIDTRELSTQLHTTLPILLDKEKIVMAFKAGRDVTVFTNLRMVVIDVQGLSGKKVEYTSIPYVSIRGFSAESAGGWDQDSEIDIYTRNLWTLAKFQQDFRKGKVDILVVQEFLAAMVLGNRDDMARYSTNTESPIEVENPVKLSDFGSWLTDNSVAEDRELINHQLHSNPPILLPSEKCEMVYKSGRDLYVYTNKRVLLIDVQGIRGKKVEYKSFPWEWCNSFEVETAGHLDRDAEVYMHMDIPHKSRIQQDILVKKGDVMEMHKYLTGMLLFSE